MYSDRGFRRDCLTCQTESAITLNHPMRFYGVRVWSVTPTRTNPVHLIATNAIGKPDRSRNKARDRAEGRLPGRSPRPAI